MKRIIAATALAVILAIATACGGDDGNGGEERLHPILHDVTYLQIQEGREYVTMTSSDTNRHLSDRIKRHPPRRLRDRARHQRRIWQRPPGVQEDSPPRRVCAPERHDTHKLTFPVGPEQIAGALDFPSGSPRLSTPTLTSRFHYQVPIRLWRREQATGQIRPHRELPAFLRRLPQHALRPDRQAQRFRTGDGRFAFNLATNLAPME